MYSHVSITDATTGIGSGPEGHLMRLTGASVRNAREHHTASIEFAPPGRGKHLSEKEKAVVETYLREFIVTFLQALLSLCSAYSSGEVLLLSQTHRALEVCFTEGLHLLI